MQSPYKRVIMFVDNAGADVVLGMLPLARELLKMGAEVGCGSGGGQAVGVCGVFFQRQDVRVGTGSSSPPVCVRCRLGLQSDSG